VAGCLKSAFRAGREFQFIIWAQSDPLDKTTGNQNLSFGLVAGHSHLPAELAAGSLEKKTRNPNKATSGRNIPPPDGGFAAKDLNRHSC
jgi:hypothetical protein